MNDNTGNGECRSNIINHFHYGIARHYTNYNKKQKMNNKEIIILSLIFSAVFITLNTIASMIIQFFVPMVTNYVKKSSQQQ